MQAGEQYGAVHFSCTTKYWQQRLPARAALHLSSKLEDSRASRVYIAACCPPRCKTRERRHAALAAARLLADSLLTHRRAGAASIRSRRARGSTAAASRRTRRRSWRRPRRCLAPRWPLAGEWPAGAGAPPAAGLRRRRRRPAPDHPQAAAGTRRQPSVCGGEGRVVYSVEGSASSRKGERQREARGNPPRACKYVMSLRRRQTHWAPYVSRLGPVHHFRAHERADVAVGAGTPRRRTAENLNTVLSPTELKNCPWRAVARPLL